MNPRAVAPRLAVWLAACASTSACFIDGGLPATGTGLTTTTAATSEPTSSATSSSSPGTTEVSTTTTEVTTTEVATTEGVTTGAAVCGDGQLDPGEGCDDGNQVDGDACLSSCQPASCGDGVLWVGEEACDAGPANHPSAPDAPCRETCLVPACGDGALYIGALGPEIVVNGSAFNIAHSDDGPRAIGVDDAGDFSVVYSRYAAFTEQLSTFKLSSEGLLIDDPTILHNSSDAIRDPVIAVAPGGDLGFAWESDDHAGDIFVLGVTAGVEGNVLNALSMKSGLQESAGIALDDNGRLVLAFVGVSNQARHIFVRRIEHFDDDSLPEFQVSEHLTGNATSPTVALAPSGAFAVAWGDPGGAIVYRRFSPDGQPGPLIKSSLQTGGLANNNNSRPWTGAALDADANLVLAGLDRDGLVSVERFDLNDVPRGRVAVSAAPRLHTPFLDVAADPWGNLAVAWAGCGEPADDGAHCGNLPHDLQLAWVRADMTLHAPPTLVHEGAGALPPIGVAVAPTGVTAVTFIRGSDIIVRIAPIICP